MKLNYLILIIIGSLLGCKTSLPKGFHFVESSLKSEDIQCDNLYKEIGKKWAINETYPNYALYDAGLVTKILQNQQCFIGKDTSNLEKLFGALVFDETCYKYYLYSVNKEIDLEKKPMSLQFYLGVEGKIFMLGFRLEHQYFAE